MSEFHREYVEKVRRFLDEVPGEVGIQAEDLDRHFRVCTLSVWARCPGGGGNVEGINEIFTGRKPAFTAQQFDRALAYYRGDIRAKVPVPDVFSHLLQWDRDHGTAYSRRFIALQKAVLNLAAAYDGELSLGETRQITALCTELETLCRQEGIVGDPSALLDLLDDVQRHMEREKRTMAGDFWGAPPTVKEEKRPAEPEKDPAAPEEETSAERQPSPEERKAALEQAMAELNAMIGLEQVKQDVNSLINLVKIRSLRQERGLKCPDLSLHLVFSGNPGTGKTTVARLIGRIYQALGILSKGHLVEVDRSGLVAGYVGQTAIKTQEVIDQAMGGILFVDEAYSLSPKEAGKDFGQEAIDTLLKAMEDHRDDFVVIVAGYASLMPRFIDSNPGLKSRFNKYLTFEDYTPQQLLAIFEGRASQNDYCLSESARSAVEERLQTIYDQRDENFGNARTVRNLFETAVANQANRLAAVDAPTDQQLQTIEAEDLIGTDGQK